MHFNAYQYLTSYLIMCISLAGELLAREVESSIKGITTYVDHFFRESGHDQVELWIVFENAGEVHYL